MENMTVLENLEACGADSLTSYKLNGLETPTAVEIPAPAMQGGG
jgi:hypothetical protein